MSCQGGYHVTPGVTRCHLVHDTVVWAAMAGPCRFAALRLCWAKRAHSADRCCAYWWNGLMLRAAVTAVRSVSFKPMLPPSGVYAGVI